MARLAGFRTNREGNAYPVFSGQTDLMTFMNVAEQDKARNAYQIKQEAKAARFEALAQKAQERSEQAQTTVNRIVESIPMGQPILVGHHSERAHRRDIERMSSAMQKAISENEKSKYYEHRAELARNPKAISSDDPEALEKLQAAIAGLEDRITELKGMELEVIAAKHPHFPMGPENARRALIASNRTEIRRITKRMEDLKSRQAIPEGDKVINGATISVDKANNRVKIVFGSMPSSELRSQLKHAGFHWSPQNQAWQRMASTQALFQAERILSSGATTS